MKSTIASGVFRVVMVAILAAVFAPQFAHADTAARGKFTLTSTAHWGRMTLPAGTYSYDVDYRGSVTRIIVSDDSGRTMGVIAPQGASEKPDTNETSIQLSFDGGEGYVSSMTVADLGLEFHFAAPNGKGVYASKGAGQPAQVAAYSAAK